MVVLSNRGPEKRVQLVLGSSSLVVELPADSVDTLHVVARSVAHLRRRCPATKHDFC